jgi:hypothetical protein
MSAYAEAVAIADAAAHDFFDGGLRSRDELLDVGVVRLRTVRADDWNRGIVEHRVAAPAGGRRAPDRIRAACKASRSA